MGIKDQDIIVQGKLRSYRITVEARDPKTDGSVNIDTPVDVTAYDATTGERVFRETLLMRPEDSNTVLRSFVEIFKSSAVNDFKKP